MFRLVLLYALLAAPGEALPHRMGLQAAQLAASKASASWSKYRLADVVKGYCAAHEGGWSAIQHQYQTSWPNSIAAQYLSRTHQPEQFGTLCDIVKQHGPKLTLPSKQEVIVHLRLGDVMGGIYNGKHTVESLFQHGGTFVFRGVARHYVKGKSYYERAIAALPSNIRNVTLVGWDGHGGHRERSEQYRMQVAKLFVQHGFHVEHRRHHLPDDDFTYMSRHAAYFILGGGMYSDFVGECVRRFGGIIIPGYLPTQRVPM